MQLNQLNVCEENNLMSIDELKALRLRKQKIDNDIKARKYISEINQRYRKMKEENSKNILRK